MEAHFSCCMRLQKDLYLTLMMQPLVSQGLLRDGILSPSGVCRPLDRNCDGLVRGEACTALVLRAATATAASLGHLLGSAVTHNSSQLPSLLSPDQAAQEAALKQAQAGHAVQLLHVHGIGQPMADTTELLAFQSVWRSGGTLLNHKANLGRPHAVDGLRGGLEGQLVVV